MNIEEQFEVLLKWVDDNSSYITTDGYTYSGWKYVDEHDLVAKIKEIVLNLGDVK